MCLAVKKGTRVKTAKEDIVVYKLLAEDDNIYKSPYQHVEWKIGETKEEEIQVEKEERCFFDDKDETDNGLCNYYITESDKNKFTFYSKGLHSVGSIERAKVSQRDHIIVKCIIPKNSKYYHNVSDLYVSNKLTIVEIVKE
jgi:hypothetical protein